MLSMWSTGIWNLKVFTHFCEWSGYSYGKLSRDGKVASCDNIVSCV